MTQTYKTIKRNYEARNGKPLDKQITKIRRKLYKLIEKNQNFTLEDHLMFFEKHGCTIELNDGVYCG